MSEYDDAPSFVGKVCGTQSRRTLLEYFLTAESGGKWRRVGELVEAAGLARNSVLDNLDVLIDVGIVEESDGDGRFTRYRRADTAATEAVESLNGTLASEWQGRERRDGDTPLTDLYGSESRGTLCDFFLWLGLEWTDGDEPLTKVEIHERAGVTRKSVIEHVDVLVGYGVADVDETYAYERYAPNVGAPSVESLFAANGVLADQYE